MGSSPTASAQEPEMILFRPSKKRKIYRQRARGDDDEGIEATASVSQIASAPSPTTADAVQNAQSLEELISTSGITDVVEGDEVEGARVSMAEILRLRKRNKRLGGVEFRVEGPRGKEGDIGEREQSSQRDEDGGDGGRVVEGGRMSAQRRFAPQTGTVGDVNKHMMDYIDSQIAKRRAEVSATAQAQGFTDDSNKNALPESDAAASSSSAPKPTLDIQRQPVTLGRLQEVDLGAEARALNEERTRRKIAGERSLEEEEEAANAARKVQKVRLGPDGKPWRSMKKRRGSEDIKRDMIVEAVLRRTDVGIPSI